MPRIGPETPDVLTTDEVAKLLRVSRRTVERMNLPSIKLGRSRRYLRESILDFLRERVA
jgi:excisionase family DNA binding protein